MQSPTVFIVTDEPAILNVLTDLFIRAQIRIKTFATAEAFLTEFNLEHSGCLLLDMSSLGMSGGEFHRMLVQRQSVIPVIILTSQGDAHSAMEMLKGGALDFFVKPFDCGALLDAVKQAIEMDSTNRYALLLRAEVMQRFAQLTQREREIIGRIIEGESSREIAVQLHMSARTVEFHRAKIKRKIGAATPIDLVRMATMALGCHCTHKYKCLQGVKPVPNFSISFS